MPLVNVKMLEGVYTPTQKQEMIRRLTDTMVSIEGESLRSATVVVLEEVKSGDWWIWRQRLLQGRREGTCGRQGERRTPGR
jgi:4-oxalocrotonate tautomerase